MEDEKGGAGSAVRASSSAAPAPAPAAAAAPPTPPSNPPKEAPVAEIPRQRFSVELRPGETTIVSWKKLLKEPNKGSGSSAVPSVANPAIDSGAGPGPVVQPTEGEPKDAVPPPNRFSAVIEKIERLYMGKQSSDEEELDDIPDDDQYDTEDSFIDDAELDEYFQVDKLATKHNGFFVNRGKLEGIEPSSSADFAPKKRRRKDSTKFHSEKDQEHMSTEFVNVGNMRIKAAARNAPLVGNKFSNPAKVPTPFGEHYQDGKRLKNKLNAPTGNYKRKSADFTVSSENSPSVKMSNKDSSSVQFESKNFDKRKTGVIPSRNIAHKSRGKGGSYDGMHQESREKGVSSQVESQPKKLLNGENEIEVPTRIRHKERSGVCELPDLNSSLAVYPLQKTTQPSIMRVKEAYAVKPKGTTLERAIRDLEKIVAESRPQNLDVQEADTSSQAIKRRLPQEVKQKLAKVAKLSATQGKISEDELIDRLMGILGHLVQRKTLKRNVKEMVELSLSANQQKADRLQQIKKEVHEMIRTHVSLMKLKVDEQKEGSADDFQEVISNDERRFLKGKYSMDKALEDKICDLYDLYVEGMDDDRGPQSRKVYVQLAELWPNGYMDNLGVKDAIYKSKERKRAMFRRHKVREEERFKRKRLASATRVDDPNLGAQVRTGQERLPTDFIVQALVSPEKAVSNPLLASSGRDPAQPSGDSGHHHTSKHIDKARGGSSAGTAPEDGSKTAAVADAKKKLKRKPESDIEEFHRHPPKLHTQQQEKERSVPHQHSDESNVGPHPIKSVVPPPGPPGSHQPS